MKAESSRTIRALAPGYALQVDHVDEMTWHGLLAAFDDSNTYQTWPYAEVMCGRRNMSHLVLTRNGEVAALAQARIKKLPFLNIGIAYVQWGPVWRRNELEANAETFRQAIRALRNEYVCKRGLSLRLFPILFDDNASCFSQILEEEGFSSLGADLRGRTILMDLAPPLPALREGLVRNWKRNLRQAEQNGLDVIEGTGEELFEAFIEIYKQMVTRKSFVEPNDIHQFKQIQSRLPEQFKMKIMLCRSGEQICAGLIWSEMGKMGIELFAATSDAGMKSKGSYLLRWKLVERLRQNRADIYNLNGINPEKNPGNYKFKAELAGKHGQDVHYIGRFDAHAGPVTRSCIEFGDTLRAASRTLKERLKKGRAVKPSPGVESTEPEAPRPAVIAPAPSPAPSLVRQMASRQERQGWPVEREKLDASLR